MLSELYPTIFLSYTPYTLRERGIKYSIVHRKFCKKVVDDSVNKEVEEGYLLVDKRHELLGDK